MKPRSWIEIGARLLTCTFLLAAGYALLVRSPIAWRLRQDVPGGVQGTLFIMSALIAYAPLLARRNYLRALLISTMLLSGFGSHWWTRVQWEEVVTESNFALDVAPRLSDHLLVMTPAFLAVSHLALTQWSILRADLHQRGADRDQVRRAAAASFLAGAAALATSLTAGIALSVLLTSGILRYGLPAGWGVPTVAFAILLVGAALATLGRDLRTRRAGGRGLRSRLPRRKERSTSARAP